MMKKLVLALFIGALVFMVVGAPVQAGEVDVLLDKLVEKGLLSPIEASIIKDETKQQVSAELGKARSYAVPSWVQKMKLQGDLRLRHQYERRNSDTEGRNRGRIRFRLGVIADPLDKIQVGSGLVTGGSSTSSARSTNQTMQDFFATKDISLDYAYLRYMPTKNIDAIAGKFTRKAYLWAPTDLLWDGDINPEGASINIAGNLHADIDGFLNGGVWVLDTNDQVDRPDPYLAYIQGGLKTTQGPVDVKVATTYYNFNGLQGLDPDGSMDTNTRVTGNVLKYDYDSVGVSAEVGVKKLFKGLPFKMDDRIALFGDYVHNPDPDTQADAWSFGAKFGHKKVQTPGTWQAKYIYAELGKDAFPDIFPDSDRYGGATDRKSHEIVTSYAWKNNVIFAVDYYKSDKRKAAKDVEHVVQADVLVKF